MFYDTIVRSGKIGQAVVAWIEAASMAIEVLAVLIIVVSILYHVLRYLWRGVRLREERGPYRALKASLGRAMLLGLEILVAADIVRTVALDATVGSVAVLGLLVFIRTFLSWALEVETLGRWPWQATTEQDT
jgi:uncharacterized membrane protein